MQTAMSNIEPEMSDPIEEVELTSMAEKEPNVVEIDKIWQDDKIVKVRFTTQKCL